MLRATRTKLPSAMGTRAMARRRIMSEVPGADVVVTTTPSNTPILHDAEAGQHITAMGSDAEHKNEIAPALLARVQYVADRLSQTRVLGNCTMPLRPDCWQKIRALPSLARSSQAKCRGAPMPTPLPLPI